MKCPLRGRARWRDAPAGADRLAGYSSSVRRNSAIGGPYHARRFEQPRHEHGFPCVSAMFAIHLSLNHRGPIFQMCCPRKRIRAFMRAAAWRRFDRLSTFTCASAFERRTRRVPVSRDA